MYKEDWDENVFPLAYLITFRTFGTWLHGDERGSVDMHGQNTYGAARISPNARLEDLMSKNMPHTPFLLNNAQREAVEVAVNEVCQHRGYTIHAINARSNHVHAVVSAQIKPERIADAFKGYATRKLRSLNLIAPWSRGRSRRYLWQPHHVALAIEYVLYGQGDIPFQLEDDD